MRTDPDNEISFTCQACGKTISVPVHRCGHVGECPYCDRYVDVPDTPKIGLPANLTDGVPGYFVVLIGCAAGAFCEELVMRGYLIPRLERLLRSTRIAVLVTTAVFASYHIYQGMVPAFRVAVGGSFARSRSARVDGFGPCAWRMRSTILCSISDAL